MRKIILLGPFPPLFSYGGPTRSIENLFNLLSTKNDCIVISPNRDLNGVKLNQESRLNKKVIYSGNTYFEILRNSKDVDIIWINSFFDFKLFFLVIFCFINKIKLVVSPRGQLSNKAINTSKPFLKYLFINCVKIFQSLLVFHVTNLNEKEDVLSFFNKSLKITSIQNLTNLKFIENNQTEIKFVFYSRIHKKKGLLKMLSYLKENNLEEIELDIYGFVEDIKYWQKCKVLIKKLKNVKYCGEINSGDLVKLRNKYSFFILPTLNENFGHVIIELISIGLIPILSKNTTPFERLVQSKVGLNFEIDSSKDFNKSIIKVLSFSKEEIDNLKINVKEIFLEYNLKQQKDKKDYVKFIKSL